MIHILLSFLRNLVIKLMLRFIKTDVVRTKRGKELSEINVHDTRTYVS